MTKWLKTSGCAARLERVILIHLEACDWTGKRDIPQRFT